MFQKAIFLILALFFVFSVGIDFSQAEDSLPDFIISRLYLPALNQYAGSPFNAQDAQVAIKNLEGQAANNVRLDFFILDSNDKTVCKGKGRNISYFSIWEQKQFTLDRYEFIDCPSLTAGSYKFKAVADYANVIAEKNEDNNGKESAVSVKSANLAPTISNLEAIVSNLTNKQVKLGFNLSSYSDSSVIEFASEDFYGQNKTYDSAFNPTRTDSEYYTVATSTDNVAYRWRVILRDSNLQSLGQIYVLMPADANPFLDILKLQDLVEVRDITDTGAKIIWRTSKESSTKITYEVNNYLVNGNSAQTKEVAGDNTRTHSVTLTNLAPNTHYYYKLESGAGSEKVSLISHFYTNEKQYQAAVAKIADVVVTGISASSAVVSWTTDIDSTGAITYEKGNAGLDGAGAKTVSVAAAKKQTITLEQLEPGAKYYYKIKAQTDGGAVEQSGDFTTETLAPAPSPACQPINSAKVGDLIKMEGNTSVYYYGQDCKRYVFPNDKIYFSWYNDFSKVKTVSAENLFSILIGGNVTYRPAVKLLKITTDPKVYAVTKGGILRWIKTEKLAQELYGASWQTKVDDVPDAFFTNYTIGLPIEQAGDYDINAQQAQSADINADKGL